MTSPQTNRPLMITGFVALLVLVLVGLLVVGLSR